VIAGTVVLPFKIDDYTAWRLIEGLDDIALTLRKLGEIEVFEAAYPDWKRALCHPPKGRTGRKFRSAI